jgi:hypothetical protein
MSKIIDNIRSYPSGRHAVAEPLEFISFNETFSPFKGIGTVYELEAIVKARVDICGPETYTDAPNVYTEAIKSVKQQIAEEIFGEFRKPLLALRTNMLKRGDRDSSKLVEDMLESMFKI